MVEGISRNITFYSIFKVFFKLYGLYLIITGLMSSLAIIPFYINISEMKDFSWMARSDDALYGFVDFLFGLFLYFMSKFISKKMVKQETEITLAESSLFDLAQATLRLLLVLALFSNLSVVLITSLILLFVPEGSDFIMIIIPLIFTIIISVLLIKTKSIVSIVIK